MADTVEPEKKRRRIEELTEKMAVDGGSGVKGDWDGRWNHVKKFLERPGPFTHPDFEPSTEARVMATIGVTRGLGDHDLKVYNSNIHIKPFLSCCPEVKVYNLADNKHGPDDVLVMGTDGLWDVTTDREVADAVTGFLAGCEPNDPMRYTLAAQDLLMRSRGVLKERGWRLPNDRLGSGDDITVFVIPLAGPKAET